MTSTSPRLRWMHRCPSCRKLLYWERIYCSECIKSIPARKSFTLSPMQGWIKDDRLRGLKETANHLYFVLKNIDDGGRKFVCIECGFHMKNAGKHRCARRIELRSRIRKQKCSVCRLAMQKSVFPIIRVGSSRKSTIIRLMVCGICLDKSVVVQGRNRSYVRKANAPEKRVAS